jgi:hypothetical protein
MAREGAYQTGIRYPAQAATREGPQPWRFLGVVGPLENFRGKEWRREWDSNPRYGFP